MFGEGAAARAEPSRMTAKPGIARIARVRLKAIAL